MYMWTPALLKGDDYRLATYAIRKPASFAGFRSVLFTGALVEAALNPRPDQDRFLTSSLMGTAREQVRTDIMHLPSFQAAMRTSARNPQNTDRKKFVVPDLATAQAIGRWLPGARVHEPVM